MKYTEFKTVLDGQLYLLNSSRNRDAMLEVVATLHDLRRKINDYKEQKYKTLIDTIDEAIDSADPIVHDDRYGIQAAFESPNLLIYAALVSGFSLIHIYVLAYTIWFST